jgi:hypothetical protein
MSGCFQLMRITSPAAWTMSNPFSESRLISSSTSSRASPKELPVFVGQQRVVADAGTVQFVGQVRGHGWGNTEWKDAAARTQPALKHSVVGAAPGQVARDTTNCGLRPALDRLAVIDAALDKGSGVIIGDLGISAGVPRPVHLTHEVAKDRIGSARKHEQELGQVRRGQCRARRFRCAAGAPPATR